MITCIIPVWNQEVLVIKALESVPADWELIVIDDGSSDNTYENVQKWLEENRKTYKLLKNDKNMGVGFTVNRGYDEATGEYIVLLGSDDYFLPEIKDVEKQINGEDMVFFDIETNDGEICKLTAETYGNIPGSVKFVKRRFLGTERTGGQRVAEDSDLMGKLNKKPHTVKFTGIVGKHYNFPREGSLSFLSKNSS